MLQGVAYVEQMSSVSSVTVSRVISPFGHPSLDEAESVLGLELTTDEMTGEGKELESLGSRRFLFPFQHTRNRTASF